MKILGVSAFYHDAAAAILINGEIIAAAQEERFTRKKNDPSFPENAIKYCLQESGCRLEELDAVVFYDKPFLKFERLLETYYAFAPKGVISFIQSVPIWVKEKLFLKQNLRKLLLEIEPFDKKSLKLLFPEHHLSHAASAFYPSPFEEAAILTIDGVGEWATATICHGQGKELTVLKELHFPHSLGLLYSSFTYFLGFKVNSGEYKMMGLAPYGNVSSENYQRFVKQIKENLVEIKEDGSIRLEQSYFQYATGKRMIHEGKWGKLFGIKRRKPTEEITTIHRDLALAIQHVTEEIILLLAREAKRLTNSKNLCLAGGVALNCVANGKLEDAKIFNQIWIQPAPGDAGGALGAALAANHIYYGKEGLEKNGLDSMKGTYLGPSFEKTIHELTLRHHTEKAPVVQFDNFEELAKQTAKLLAEGQVVGWFQGRMEFGPRALGNRSILGDARSPVMQSILNQKIKNRERFRPFAPCVLLEDSAEYFEVNGPSPYMLQVKKIRAAHRKPLPANYQNLGMMEQLYVERSCFPAVTHVDYSARIQTVDGNYNSRFYKLLQEFKKITTFGVLINTSFNVKDEPIVCTPEDAYQCFMKTEMDYLVIHNCLFSKEQPTQSSIHK